MFVIISIYDNAETFHGILVHYFWCNVPQLGIDIALLCDT